MKKNFLVSAGAFAIVVSMLFMTACGEVKYNDPYSGYKMEDYVKLGKFEGIELTKPDVKVSKAELDAEIEARVAEKTTEEHKKEGTAENGNKVNISYVGKKDGKAFDGGSTGDAGTEIVLGSSDYIPGFDDGVTGMKVGETKDLNLTFPADYHEKSLAGKPVVFTVTLNYISVPKPVKYDMDYVKSVSKASSIKDYEAEVKKEIKTRKEAEAENALYGKLWQEIVDSAKIKKYPKKEVERVLSEGEKKLEEYAKMYNMDKDDFIKDFMQMDKKQYEEYAKEQAKFTVAQEMVFSVLLKNYDIKISDSEYKEKLNKIYEEQGIDEEAYKKANGGKSFEEVTGKDKLVRSFLIEKVLETAYSKAKVN